MKTVTVVGRRGHVQSAFTIKELRELTRMRGVKVHISETDLEKGRTEASLQELEGNRPKKRIVELIETIALGGKVAAEDETGDAEAAALAENQHTPAEQRTIKIQYLTTPVEVVGDEATQQRVKALRVVRNKLTGPAGKQKAVPLVPGMDGEEVEAVLPCDLLIRRRLQVRAHQRRPAVQQHHQHDPAREGPRHRGYGKLPLPGMYVTGWLKRGATGIIASNIPDAKETAAAIAEDLRGGLLKPLDDALLQGTDTTSTASSATSAAGAAVPGPPLPWMKHLPPTHK